MSANQEEAFSKSPTEPMSASRVSTSKSACLIFALTVIFLLITGTGLIFIGVSALFSNLATSRQRAEETATARTHLNATATAIAVRSTATAQPQRTAAVQAMQATATAASQWRVVLTDSFDANVNLWRTGDVTDEFGAFNRTLSDGKYRLTAKAAKSVVSRQLPRVASVTDFYFTVEGRRISGPKSGDYGVIFRNDIGDNYYLFALNDDQFFRFSLRYQDRWIPLLEATRASSIRPDEVNKITVIAQGSHFVFFINDQYAGEANDSHVTIGKPGIAIILRAGDEAVFEFDNFEVRAP